MESNTSVNSESTMYSFKHLDNTLPSFHSGTYDSCFIGMLGKHKQLSNWEKYNTEYDSKLVSTFPGNF